MAKEIVSFISPVLIQTYLSFHKTKICIDAKIVHHDQFNKTVYVSNRKKIISVAMATNDTIAIVTEHILRGTRNLSFF